MLRGTPIANQWLLFTLLYPWAGTMSVEGLEGRKKVSYFNPLICVALPQHRVPHYPYFFWKAKSIFLIILFGRSLERQYQFHFQRSIKEGPQGPVFLTHSQWPQRHPWSVVPWSYGMTQWGDGKRRLRSMKSRKGGWGWGEKGEWGEWGGRTQKNLRTLVVCGTYLGQRNGSHFLPGH